MPQETGEYTNSRFKILPYLTAFLLICLFIVKNAGFFKYLSEPGIIAHIWLGALIGNLIVTPALLIVFLAAFWYLGAETLNLLKADHAAGEYKHVFSFVLGTGVMNLILMVLGAAGIFERLMVIIVISLFAVAALNKLIKAYNNRVIPPKVPQAAEYPAQAVLIVIFYVLSCGYILALSPPSSWDSLSYHLPIAKQYLEAARIFPIPYYLQHQCSIGMEMLTAAALAFNSDKLAQLLSLASFIITLRIIYIFVKMRVSGLAGALAAALFAVLPVSLYLMGKVNNDYYVTMFAAAAIVALVEFKKSGQKGLFVIALLSAGFTANAKLSGFIVVVLVALLVAYWIIRRAVSIKGAGLVIAVFALITSVTLARNFIFTGNPVFPIFYQQLGGKGMSKENYNKQHINDIETTSIKPDIKNYLMLPYHLIANSDRFQNQPRYFIAMFITLFVIRLGMRKTPEEEEMILILFVVGFITIWFFSGRHIWRFVLPVLPAAVTLIIIWSSKIGPKVLKIVAGAVIAINFVPITGLSINNNLFAVFALPSKANPKLSPKDNYLLKTLDNYDTYTYLNTNTAGSSKILLFKEFRSYYVEREYMIGDPLIQNELRYEEMKNSSELAAALSKNGITHVLVNFNIYPPCSYYYDNHIMDIMREFTENNCIMAYKSNGVELYEIKR